MVDEAHAVIDAFSSLRCLVIGDAMLDSYLEGPATRLSPEAPVPVVDIQRTTDCPGGAANVAANLAALGASVTILTALGDDETGNDLVALLDSSGVDVSPIVRDPERASLRKTRLIAAG